MWILLTPGTQRTRSRNKATLSKENGSLVADVGRIKVSQITF